MLDLNADIISSDSSSSCHDNKALLMGKPRDHDEELSAGTSDSSSVVNSVEAPAIVGDENSSLAVATASSCFVFDVFKLEKDGAGGGCSSSAELFTRQLFPALASGSPEELGVAPIKAPRPQWLNLSFGGGGDPLLSVEGRSFQPQRQQQVRKSRRGPRSRSSQYRGVTFYRRTGRWESHIWDCGKQVYLGGFDTAYAAARAYDRAAIKFRGVDADINFNISDYEEDMKQMGNLNKEEFVQILRRQSTGFSRGSSKFRGMAALTKTGRWDTRVGQFMGKVPHDKVVIQYGGRETGTSLKHGAYEREIIMNVPGEGSGGQNLDLNLGMALPLSESKKVKVGTGNSYMNCIDCEAPGRELTVVNRTGVVSAPNKHHPSWPAMHPFLLPSSEGKAVEKRRIEAPANTNFWWQIPIDGNYGSGGTSATPLMFSSNAASSGFSCNNSSSKTNSSSNHHQLHLIHKLPGGSINNNTTQAFPFFTFRS